MADVLPRFLPVLLQGLVVAVKVALGAFALALSAGLILALLTRSPSRAACASLGHTSSSCAARPR